MTTKDHITLFEYNIYTKTYRFTCSCGAFTVGSLAECKSYDHRHADAWVTIDPNTGKQIVEERAA